MAADMIGRNSPWFSSPFLSPLVKRKPQISLKHVRLVVGPLLVEQFRLGFPVEPAIVERAIGMTNNTAAWGGPSRFKSMSLTAMGLYRADEAMTDE